ncbi:MAG: MAPEG family protein [Pseudomonadota bacterium]
MDIILSLWTAAPILKTKLLVIMISAQMILTIWCYYKMSAARVGAVKAGKITPEIYKAVGDAEPEEVRVFTRLVANQFELPVLFYAIILTSLAIGVASWLTVVLAGLFVATRVIHAREMAGEHVVLRRRRIFVQTVRITLLMILELLISTLFML